jgi:hypothetical protein
MVIGGEVGEVGSALPTANTYIFNTRDPQWLVGPPLLAARVSHSCARIRRNAAATSSFSVIAAGGRKNDATVEILDDATGKIVLHCF